MSRPVLLENTIAGRQADSYEIEPASIHQLRRAKNGKWVEISADAGGVAAGLARIDPRLRVRYSGLGCYYVVYWQHTDPCADHCKDPGCHPDKTDLVLTAQELDQRIVARIELIDSHGRGGYDLVKEIERMDKQEAQRKGVASRRTDEQHEQLLRREHELRQTLPGKPRIVVPRDV